MFFKSQKVLKYLKIYSDGSLNKNFANFNSSNVINFLEKDFKLFLKESSNKKPQSSNILSHYRKNIFK